MPDITDITRETLCIIAELVAIELFLTGLIALTGLVT